MPFRLDLVRHGEAEPARSGGDADRALTAAGRRDVTRLAKVFVHRGWVFERVYTSPLLRALETASILIAWASPGAATEVLDSLVPEGEPEDVLEALSASGIERHAVLVGHQPLLGRLAGHLTGGASLHLPTGGLVALRCDGLGGRGCAVLEIELDPARLTES